MDRRAHTVFQFNHFGRHIGIDPDMRDAYLGHPYYDDAAEFADLYDSESFDPSYESLPLEEFEPLLRQVFVSSERSPFELGQRRMEGTGIPDGSPVYQAFRGSPGWR